MIDNDDNIGNARDHKVSASRTTDPFDKMLSGMIGLPNGAHTKAAVVQAIDFYGHATSYIIQTVRTDERITVFVQQISATGAVRSILPAEVLSTIDRQRESITKKIRRRNGKRIAEERMRAGIQPGFMKSNKAR